MMLRKKRLPLAPDPMRKSIWFPLLEMRMLFSTRLFLGDPTGIEIPGESSGLLRRPDRWSALSQASLAIGYEMLTTSLQLVMAYGALANGGTLLKPALVREVRTEGESSGWRFEPEPIRRVIDRSTAHRVSGVLEAAVGDGGTGTEASLATLKIAGKTLGTGLSEFGVSGAPMPSSPDTVSEDELEVIRQWIRGGAPRAGVVKDAPDVLGCGGVRDPSPNKIPPLPAPAVDEGVQLRSGGWKLGAESEDEVCYVTYYDYSDRVPSGSRLPCPEEYGGPDRECFAFNTLTLAQDPQSHHRALVRCGSQGRNRRGNWRGRTRSLYEGYRLLHSSLHRAGGKDPRPSSQAETVIC